MEAIEQAQKLDRHSVRDRAAEQFDSERNVDSSITAVNKARRDWQGGPSTQKTRWQRSKPRLLLRLRQFLACALGRTFAACRC